MLDYPALLILIFGLTLSIDGLKKVTKIRRIRDLQTSKIRSIAMGLVEIRGKVVPTKTFKSILKNECIFYEWIVEQKKIIEHEDGSTTVTYKTKYRGSKGHSFYVQDETGKVLVDAQGAELHVRESSKETAEARFSQEFPDLADFGIRDSSKKLMAGKFLIVGEGGGKIYRLRERFITAGDELYVVGTAGDNPSVEEATGQANVDDIMIQKGNDVYLISNLPKKEVMKLDTTLPSFKLKLGVPLILYGIIAFAASV